MAIVGAGKVAGGYDKDRSDGNVFSHAGAYRAHGGFDLLVCIEPDHARRAGFQARWGIPHGFPDVSEWLCNGPEVDIVSVCTPDETHASVLFRLLEVPIRAVWTEKPLATDLAAARRVCDGFSARGVPLAVNYLRRWDSAMHELRDALARGALGEMQSAVAYYGKGLLHNGSHAIDLLHFLLGPLRTIWARQTEIARDGSTYDATLTAPRGASVWLAGTDADAFSLFEMSLLTTRTRIDILDSGRTLAERHIGPDADFAGHRSLGTAIARPTGLGQAMVRAAGNLFDAVRSNAPLGCNAADALATLETCFDIMSSAGEPT